MQELALHVLDIVQNSIRAGATHIQIGIEENIKENSFVMVVTDNGVGIDECIKPYLTDPFTTTRTLRKVGLGLPFLKQMCQETEGDLKIESEKGIGTKVTATMTYNHIDRLPLGAIEKTIGMLILARPDIWYTYEHRYEKEYFKFDSLEIQSILDGVPIANLEIIHWIEGYIKENLKELTLSIK